MIRCPNCGNLNYEENNFCGKCGARLPSPKVCPECGYKSFIDNFCTYCGTKLISQSDIDKMEKLMDEAFYLRLDKMYNQAIRKYDSVLQIYPKYIDALKYKGHCLKYQYKFDKAIACFDKILEIDSNNSSAWDNKGDCLYYQYKYDEAIDCYNKALKFDPENQFTLKSKAKVLLSMSEYDEIPEILSKIKPESAYYWRDLSDMYLQINDFDNALKCLENIDEEGWKESIYCHKSNIYERLGKYDFILDKCNEKLQINSNNPLALKSKAGCLKSLKKYDDILICYDKLIEIDSNDSSALKLKVGCLKSLKKYDEISDILSKIKPENGDDLRYLSERYLEIKEFDESLKYLNKYIENFDFFNPFVVDMYLKLDKSKMAFDYIHKALKKNPNDYYVLCSKGDYYEYTGKFDKALELYNKLISINKYNTLAYFHKIDLLLKLEKYSEVKKVLLDIKHPNNYNHWYRISKYYEQLNDYDNALEYIDKTINLNYNIEYLVKKAEILYELKKYDEALEVCSDASKLNSDYDKLISILNKIKSSGE